MKKIVLTRAGFTKLKEELDYLKHIKRREIASQLEHARSLGDLSENAEYDATKDTQAHREKRIAELKNTITNGKLMEEENSESDRVLIGATVTMKDLSNKNDSVYTIVSQEEADFSQNRISITSPIGKGLLGHRVGEEIDIKVPKGILKYKIIKIERLL